MSEDYQKLTIEQIMVADPESLSSEDLLRRINITNLRKAERELELVETQNTRFQDDKLDRQRVADNKTRILKEEQDRLHREQHACKHRSGGKGLSGIFNGDGKWGYSVVPLILPTSEVYFLCVRCAKEWHMPKKRDVLTGKISLAEYYRTEQEYKDVASWEKPLFSTDSGEFASSVRFYIPRLEAERVEDDQAFAALVATQTQQPV